MNRFPPSVHLISALAWWTVPSIFPNMPPQFSELLSLKLEKMAQPHADATQKCAGVYPQCNSHAMEHKSLRINVPTSLSFRETVLGSKPLINTYFIAFLPFFSLYFPHFCDYLQYKLPISTPCLRVSFQWQEEVWLDPQ